MANTDPGAWNTTYWPAAALQALGRIIELDALLEQLARHVLGRAVGLSHNAADALFMGDRVNAVARRLRAVQALAGNPAELWIEDAVTWASRVSSLQERRHNVIHRPPVMLAGDDDTEPHLGWGRARQSHTVERARSQPILDLISEMEEAYRHGLAKFYGDSFSDAPPEWSARESG